MNNKVSTIINAILSLAVIVLFVLYFNLKNSFSQNTDVLPSSKADNTVQKLSSAETNSAHTPKIAYFELDSLENNYSYFKKIKRDLVDRENGVQAQIRKMQNTFNDKVKDFQKKGPTLSQNEQMAYQEQLGKMQQDYGVKQQQLVDQLHEEQNRKLVAVKAKIQSFLKQYAKDHGFTFVMATDDNDNIYYKDASRNITVDLVNELNKTEK